jgi:PilZ domain
MFKALFGKSNGVSPGKLPQLHAFVDVIVEGRPSRSVTVEAINAKGITTRDPLGSVGESAVLIYNARDGRFRAPTKIAGVTGSSTLFEMPKKVNLIGAAQAERKRQSVRLDALVPGEWRFAPGGVGVGDFQRASIRDISRGGCALIIDRALKLGTKVEIRLSLKGDAPALTLLGEVMRQETIQTSGKNNHGIRFHGLRPEEDQAIITFINQRQADLRSRGLA